MPTVLGYLGAATHTAFDGVDLVNTVADPRDPRMLFLRTSHPRNGMVAARTTSWKQISWPRLGSQWLFDLRSDPTEKSNLVAKHPDRYASMGLRIRRHLVEAASRRLGEAGEVELTEEAEESLKALGYLE